MLQSQKIVMVFTTTFASLGPERRHRLHLPLRGATSDGCPYRDQQSLRGACRRQAKRHKPHSCSAVLIAQKDLGVCFLDAEFSLEGFDNGRALRPLFGRTKPGE